MVDPCFVLIAAPDLLPALEERIGAVNGELLTFTDAEALRALEEIIKRQPHTIALERHFAATPRGTALMNRIKADPALAGSEIRVVSHDTDHTRVVRRSRDAAAPAKVPGPTIAPAAAAVPAGGAAPPPLDVRGTRRAPRFKIGGDMSALVDGNAAKLVDLSTVGAQVISPTVLKPNQRVRMALTDEHGAVRFNAAVAWASFEIPATRGPQYRAGINFVDADDSVIGAFCARHKQP